jgi:hypothetical protein
MLIERQLGGAVQARRCTYARATCQFSLAEADRKLGDRETDRARQRTDYSKAIELDKRSTDKRQRHTRASAASYCAEALTPRLDARETGTVSISF